MRLIDGPQRELATDPQQSFIVQAPAGSGKTEMLSQRFLRLLGVVQNPEQIVALTFTRKAAAEMRERIIKALYDARQGLQSTSPHQQQTLAYAEQAMRRSEELGWNLLEQPWRLRIMTIDSLCQALCTAIPIQEKAIPFGEVTEDSQKLYEEATRACFDSLQSCADKKHLLTTLLAHLDNRMDSLIKLCCALLAKREQWLPMVLEARNHSRESLEHALKLLVTHEIGRFIEIFPHDQKNLLMHLVQCVASVSDYAKYDLRCLLEWERFDAITPGQLTALSHILLNTSHELRSQYDNHIGFKKASIDPQRYQDVKGKSKHLQNQLKTIPGFRDQMVRLRELPAPAYTEKQWEILSCLQDLLLHLCIHLQYHFQQSHRVDFSAIATQAVSALGEELEPTDLALYMDNRIHHLLVDEFQDTSQNQYDLLRKLVMGWENQDGRTLFLVGDPMQSIYRFRQAEVGLFIKAREEGIGAVNLTPLELQTNFRSSPGIVDWVNQHFSHIFPPRNDIEAGAVRYHPSVAIHTQTEGSYIEAFQLQDAEQEAQTLLQIIQCEQQEHPNQSIAILVRSRSHLTRIMARLREAGVAFQGVDIDLLATLPHIQDVWSLTQIMLYPANRLAWFSLLRSPFCGMELGDLHALASVNPQAGFLDLIADSGTLQTLLSPKGWQRLQFVTRTILREMEERHQQKLAPQLARILQLLGADRIYDAKQFAELEQYWLLLDKFETDGLLRDQSGFVDRLKRLYSQASAPANLQIMTIHKSKGLEFDTVILPHLGAGKNTPTPDLIRWLNLPQRQDESLFLLAPLKAASQEKCPLYSFLQNIDDEKDAYEQQRLLYVASTRARQRLYLTDHNKGKNKNSMRALLENVDFTDGIAESNYHPDTSSELPRMERIPLAEQLQNSPVSDRVPDNLPLLHQKSDNQTAVLGTWTHQILQWINEQQIFDIEQVPWHWVEAELKAIGWEDQNCTDALTQMQSWIGATLGDSVGQWILQVHAFSRNEMAILEKNHHHLLEKRPDRLFRDENQQLWVVDFKTGRSEKSLQTQHRAQVDDYARLLIRIYKEPICCGLYYLDQQVWVHWNYQSGEC